MAEFLDVTRKMTHGKGIAIGGLMGYAPASPHSGIKTEAGKLTQKGMTHMLTCQCSVDVGRREL